MLPKIIGKLEKKLKKTAENWKVIRETSRMEFILVKYQPYNNHTATVT